MRSAPRLRAHDGHVERWGVVEAVTPAGGASAMRHHGLRASSVANRSGVVIASPIRPQAVAMADDGRAGPVSTALAMGRVERRDGRWAS